MNRTAPRLRPRWICRALAPTLLGFYILVVQQPQDARAADASSSWQQDWQRVVTAAEKEAQVTVYAPPGKQYQDAIGMFQEKYPRIHLNYVPGSGTNNSQKLLSERRADKYLTDAFIGGSGTRTLVLLKSHILDPIPPVPVLPENKEGGVWFSKKNTSPRARSRRQ